MFLSITLPRVVNSMPNSLILASLELILSELPELFCLLSITENAATAGALPSSSPSACCWGAAWTGDWFCFLFSSSSINCSFSATKASYSVKISSCFFAASIDSLVILMISFSSFFINFVRFFVSFSSSLVVFSVSFLVSKVSLLSSFALALVSSTLSWALSVVNSSFFSDEEEVFEVEEALFKASWVFSSSFWLSASEALLLFTFVFLSFCSTSVFFSSSWTFSTLVASVVVSAGTSWAGASVWEAAWVVSEFSAGAVVSAEFSVFSVLSACSWFSSPLELSAPSSPVTDIIFWSTALSFSKASDESLAAFLEVAFANLGIIFPPAAALAPVPIRTLFEPSLMSSIAFLE